MVSCLVLSTSLVTLELFLLTSHTGNQPSLHDHLLLLRVTFSVESAGSPSLSLSRHPSALPLRRSCFPSVLTKLAPVLSPLLSPSTSLELPVRSSFLSCSSWLS